MNEIRTVGVAGSGTMGAGIAIVSARAGLPTLVYDQRQEALDRARRQTDGFFAKSVERGKLTKEAAEVASAAVRHTTRIEDLADCDLITEAVFEDLGIKRTLLGRLNEICPQRTIFASNTSTLSITEIASGCGREDRVVGMHYCLPAQLMQLVEMSAGLNTAEQAFRVAWDFCIACGQRPVRTQDSPGFILNYLLVPFINDTVRLVEAGVAEPADIDRAIKTGLGHKMGPCELLDLIGLDTQILLCEAFHGMTNDPRAACPPLVRRMVAAGHLGRKSGRGFYIYQGDTMFGG